MAQTILLKRKMNGLFPADAMAENAITNLPLGKTLKAEVTVPRNVDHLRKFFALLEAVFPHQEVYPTLDLFRKALTVALGYGDRYQVAPGKYFLEPKSIAFGKMDQREFNEFYDRAVAFILEKILPGVNQADLEAQVLEILEGRGP